jgi:hypothetical protein
MLYTFREKWGKQLHTRRTGLPTRLEHVLIPGVDFGLVLFTSDRGITPAAAAKLADDHGFSTFYVPEHTHIPVKRAAAHPTTGDETLPDDRYMRTLDPWPKPVQAHIPILVSAAGTEKNFKRVPPTAGSPPRVKSPSTTPSTCCTTPGPASGRGGAPQIVALDVRPDPDKLARWRELGVTEVLFGLRRGRGGRLCGAVGRQAGRPGVAAVGCRSRTAFLIHTTK